MTITTEQLHDVIDACGRGAAMRGLFDKDLIERMARELLAAREAVPALPVQHWEELCRQHPNMTIGDAIIRAAWWNHCREELLNNGAPPAPAYPENLPCPVRLMPSLLFGKGVPTGSMLDALKRRAEYEAELEAMTPEQKAEHDAAGELFKSMLPTPAPAPAVNSELLEAMEEVIRISDREHEAWSRAKEAIATCRAAMLGNSNSPEIPDGWVSCEERMPEEGNVVLVCQEGGIIYCAEMQDGELYPDEFPRVPSEGREITHWMPLPAAPEVGE